MPTFALLLAPVLAAADAPDFARDVRPILSNHCFRCHGPDESSRKADLRLDRREGVDFAAALERVHSSDESEVMPPPETKKPLSDAQKATLKAWVAAGAAYAEHWAFRPPVARPTPNGVHLIDHWVRDRLAREGLKPAPSAERATLARRVSLDLTGLPPTPEEADAFLGDARPDAYERYVDRLLASPHYGERWARLWLDLARYADTNGYEKDRPRSIWPYRDWVIEALNRDLPFDQFTVEQLAGDMLPNATPAQRVATGFHRNTQLNEEGGIDPQEFRYHAVADRVATTGTAWLGLTLGCAQCHTHKYDPVTHRDYFGVFALLNNADEPDAPVERPGDAESRAKVQAEVRAAEAALPEKFPGGRAKFDAALNAWAAAESPKSARWEVVRPTAATATLPTLAIEADASVYASGDQSKSDTYTLTFGDTGGPITGVRIEALADERLPGGGPGRVYYEGPTGEFWLSDLRLSAAGAPAKWKRATQSFLSSPASNAIDDNLQTGWGIGGGQGRSHWAAFELAAPVSAKSWTLSMLFEKYYAAGLGRLRVSVTRGPVPDARDIPAEVDAVLATPEKDRSPEQRLTLAAHFARVAPELAEARKAVDAIRARMPKPPTTLVMRERPAGATRPTKRHHRGEYLQPREAVAPAVPAVLPGAAADRLAFARWLVSRDNPLTARVTANRHWAAFFGTGLVRTVGDFGLQGEMPSHPELLDALALAFMDGGWSQKRLHRLIVTSETYRQRSHLTPELLSRDPGNRLLARGPRVRLEAEMVRDAALRASGLLSPKVGGPSVYPPQPAGVTQEGTYGKLDWPTATGEDRYRRGLYTFAKRTAPYAAFAAFDAPTGDVCVARREATNTPIQALTLLNDTAFVEAAQALGRLAAAAPGDDAAKARLLATRAYGRPPAADEVALIAGFVASQRARISAKQLDAAKVAGGDSPEAAAWALAARALFNSDAFIVKD